MDAGAELALRLRLKPKLMLKLEGSRNHVEADTTR
jgi:hypothetical protein